MKIEHWITWICPGTFMPETIERRVDTRNLDEIIVPKDVYAFRFYDKKKLEAMDEEGNKRIFVDRINESPRYIIGTIYTLEQIKEVEDSDILYRNVCRSDTQQAVLTKLGNWQPLLKDDIVIDPDTNPYNIQYGPPIIYKNME